MCRNVLLLKLWYVFNFLCKILKFTLIISLDICKLVIYGMMDSVRKRTVRNRPGFRGPGFRFPALILRMPWFYYDAMGRHNGLIVSLIVSAASILCWFFQRWSPPQKYLFFLTCYILYLQIELSLRRDLYRNISLLEISKTAGNVDPRLTVVLTIIHTLSLYPGSRLSVKK